MFDKKNGPILRTAFQVQAPDGTQQCNASINQGTIPSSRVPFSVNPTANDTLAIGGTTFKFVAALGAAAAQVQVLIGASAAATLASLISAINGTTSDVTWVEATTPFAKTVLADAVTATVLRLRWATKRGGLPLAGVAASTALTASVTGGASAWNNDNLNTMGKAPQDCNEACGQFAITAAMVAALANGIAIELPFTPTVFQWMVIDTNGGGRWTITDRMTISGNALVLTSNGATHVAATDQLCYWASA